MLNTNQLLTEEISLIHYGYIVWKNRIKIFLIVFITTIIMSFVIMYTPKTYLAEASILPMSNENNLLGGAASVLPFAGMGGGTSVSKLLAVLNSKTIAKRVVVDQGLVEWFKKLNNKDNQSFSLSFIVFKLKKILGPKDSDRYDKHAAINTESKLKDKTIKYLKKQTSIEVNMNGLVNIRVEWSDPQTSANLVNAYIEFLSRFLNDQSMNVNFQVIDHAQAPTQKYKPKGFLLLLITMFISFCASVIVIIVTESYKNIPKSTR